MKEKGIPTFTDSETTEKVQKLFDYIQELEAKIEQLLEENRKLKGLPLKPKLNPAIAVKKEAPNSVQKRKVGGSQTGSPRQTTQAIKIDEVQVIEPVELPVGSVFKGFSRFIVRDLKISSQTICYQLARYETPEGTLVSGKLPKGIRGHFGASLRAYSLYQHSHCRVPEPLLLEQLREFGVQLSSGQLHRLLTEGHEGFHEEKDSILEAGLNCSSYVQVDDTGARHEGKNGVCTVVCNPFFASFKSTFSKSRINFLEILQGKNRGYTLTTESIEYAWMQGFPKGQSLLLEVGRTFVDEAAWRLFLKESKLDSPWKSRIATEAALLGHLLEQGFSPELGILSDDAGPFNLFQHGLCWIHAERKIKELEPWLPTQAQAIAQVREAIWAFYKKLQTYSQKPDLALKKALSDEFDLIFTQKTIFVSLNLALKRMYRNKKELLLILEKPDIPLHNNQCESDIREMVQRRKISVTQSPLGTRCRDTFASLKKTCRKNGISFWLYLKDRLEKIFEIPPLGQVVKNSIFYAHSSQAA